MWYYPWRITPLYEIPVLSTPSGGSPLPPLLLLLSPSLLSAYLVGFFLPSLPLPPPHGARFCLPPRSSPARASKSKRIITEQSRNFLPRPINDLFRDRTSDGNRLHSAGYNKSTSCFLALAENSTSRGNTRGALTPNRTDRCPMLRIATRIIDALDWKADVGDVSRKSNTMSARLIHVRLIRVRF